jgi:cysteine synthase
LKTTTDKKIAQNALDLIGNTPMVYLNKLNSHVKSEIAVKLEMFNPGSSVKDRVGLAMIEDAETKGLLIPGMSTIIEPTSGNTGIGLALAANLKGYSCIIVMPDSMSIERRKILKAFGAKVVLTPGSEGILGAAEKTEELLKEIPNSWAPMQFNNLANPDIHWNTTGREIWEDTNGDIDVFVCGVGTGGTLSGIAKYLKEKKPSIKVVAVEPKNSCILSGGEPGTHKIQGLNGGFIAETTDLSLIDEIITVRDEDAMEIARELPKKEGLFVGISSGAAVYAALKVAEKVETENNPKKVVALLPDTGERYLSSELWNDL